MSKLFIVPTPIGNLGDITLRALEVLRSVSLVLAEDTRTSGNLLRHYSIETPLRSHHKFNEHQSVEAIAEQIAAGLDVALISDAGTPGISDPGFLLVRTCLERGVEVECLPGATAFVPALVQSGMPCDRFVFEGFLPQKKGRSKRIEALQDEDRTMVFYESPFRLVKLLEQLMAVFGPDRRVSVSRELTKLHEETMRGTLAEVAAHFNSKTVKGEVVVVVQGLGRNKSLDEE
ncbi:MAG TPA: 16S rRNA (cytidine(1402)-2'-O)-methyltransferase [Tenuifilaceae bacterium]|jgi:16S rRNA (cytidine1402-2'-O)-methyltransferase|nr:16S rRNA (cytidine(1402)-2'-O)-methyltransferase [Bacteroidales bacterium]HNY09236.1 16S rRNA (cytidine(1402)-2'-O)-methyltransferase [Tenuifilaceae bacterium]MBP8643590.1 16S rRNA (cytidine(1402)-2'-O)-methyltransferase [Bacteroidales bacterium]HOA09710.1 16S rRNA (cytidine(1402)-2'-O)-methyltransferase [Tenuifilaceae bacterium]HOC36646.1 16S rRNA (cytidine(1402)-2'-O)-methyltransferase [Tenuifilaceae bacterium]